MKKSRSGYLTVSLTAVLVAVVLSALVWRLAEERKQVLESWKGRIESVAERVGENIESWLSERRAGVTLVANWPSVAAVVSEGSGSGEAGTHLADLLLEWMSLYDYSGVHVLSSDGRILVSARSSEGLTPQDLEAALRCAATGTYTAGEMVAGSNGHLHIGFFAPVRVPGRSGPGAAGVVAVLADPYDRLFPMVTNESVPTRTGETLILKKQGSGLLFISPLRHQEGLPGTFFLADPPANLAGLLAAEGKELFGELVDYRGKPVLASARYIKEVQWGLVRKVDLAEALAGWRTTVVRESVATFLLLFLVGALAEAQRRRQEASHYRLLARSEARRAALAAAVPDLIVLMDGDGRFTWLNGTAQAFFGGEALGKHFLDFVGADEMTSPLETLNRPFDGTAQPLPAEALQRRRDGKVRLLAWHCRPVTREKGVDEVLCVARDITEQRRAAEETARQKEWLRVILQSIGDGVLAVDMKRRLTLINPVAESLTGWPVDEALGRDMAEVFRIFNEKTGLPATNPLDRVLAEGVVVGLANHTVLVARDGTVRPISDSGAPIRDCEGNLLGAVMVFRDATEQRAFEIELWESREHYRALYEAVGGGVVVLETDGTIADVNDFAEEILGLSRRELVGSSCFPSVFDVVLEDGTLLPAGEFPGIESLRSSKAQHGMVMGLRHRHTGRQVWIQVNAVPLFGHNGLVVDVVTTFMDITARKKAEAELAGRKEFLERILQTAGVVIALFDPDARFMSLNRFGELLTGYREDEVKGKKLLSTFVPIREREALTGVFKEILAGRVTEGENVILAKDGQELLVRWYSSLLHDPDGRVSGVLLVAHDVTELRTIEAQLRQAQKMEAVGQLAGGIAHDFNNLLTGILGNLSLALADAPPGSTRTVLLEEAERAARRAAEITAQLLGFSRKAMLQTRPVNVNDCINETVTILRRTIDPRIAVETYLKPELWLVQADPAQVTQVLMNLCLNAQDAMPEDGTIILETGNVTLGEDYARIHPAYGRAGEFVMISVSDTGCGMPPEVRERIFEPFFTTKEPGRGTGLGLAMVYGIVRQQDGWIECYSEVGIGTRFIVYLPRLLGDSLNKVNSTLRPEEALHGSETVLVVDDEEMIRNLAGNILTRYGYKVLTAVDGQAALEVYRQEKGRVGLVLLDMIMPGLSGRDTMNALKEIDPGVVVLLSSGYSLNGIGEGLLAAGAAGFVQKPYRAVELVRAVRQALDMKARHQRKDT